MRSKEGNILLNGAVNTFHLQTTGLTGRYWVHIFIPFQPRAEEGRKTGNVLFNDTLNTFYLELYGIGHMVSTTANGLHFLINSKGSFICTISQTG